MNQILRNGWMFSVLLLAIVPMISSRADDTKQQDAPGVIDMKETKFKIVDALYVCELQGADGTNFKETEADKYHGLVLTVEVKKPAGKQLTLYMQDFTLHYYHGADSSDVLRCQGMSGFSSEKAVDRPMILKSASRGTSQTGAATMKSDTVYIDLFFNFLEPDTRELHLLVAQPCALPYSTSGWKN